MLTLSLIEAPAFSRMAVTFRHASRASSAKSAGDVAVHVEAGGAGHDDLVIACGHSMAFEHRPIWWETPAS
jgi:hypothetical protein